MNARPVPTLVGALACLLCATALTPLFDGLWWWFVPVTVATVVCVGVCVLSRLLRLPAVGQAALGLLGLLVTVTALSDARTDAFAGVLPTPSAIAALGDLIAAGTDDIAQLAAPVPERPGLVVLTVVGVYAVVLIVDVLVVALGRPTLAGLPLLGLFAVPAAVLDGGVGIVPFLLGAVGFLLLLVIDGRESAGRWGRPVNGHRAAAVRSGSVTLGARVAISTLVVAVVVPLVVPTLDNNGLLGRSLSSAAGGSGPSTANVLQPIAQLRQQLQNQSRVELMRVDSTQAPYLRLTALDVFDGAMFKLKEIRVDKDLVLPDGLPERPSGVQSLQVVADVTVLENYEQRLLPVPGIPTDVDGLTGAWHWDDATGTVFSAENTTAGAEYRVEASVTIPSVDFLAQDNHSDPIPDELTVDTKLPDNLDPRIGDLVTSLTADKSNSYEKVNAIQEHLRGPLFTYDLLGAPTNASTALQTFLFESRTGYCEQFASAMVVMVRKLGIPARVAIGFSSGTQNPLTGVWTITNKDAHAWPEVWFPQSGWVRFEPTRRDDGATPPPPYSEPNSDVDEPTTGPTAVPTDPAIVPVPLPVPGDGATPPTAEPTAPASDDTAAAPGNGLSLWGILAVAGLALAVVAVIGIVATPALLRRNTRSRRLAAARMRTDGGAGVHEAWAELIDHAADLGVPLSPAESPRAGAARLGNYLEAGPEADEPRVQAARDALGRLALAEEHARYAPPDLPIAKAVATRIADDLTTVSKTMWAVSPRGQRLRATLLPPSLMSRLAAMVTEWFQSVTGGQRRHRTAGEDSGGYEADHDGSGPAAESPSSTAGHEPVGTGATHS